MPLNDFDLYPYRFTSETYKNAKPGDKIIRITQEAPKFNMNKGQVYTIKEIINEVGTITVEQKTGAERWNLNYFMPYSPNIVAKILAERANSGRDAANELLDNHSDLVKIVDGRYIIDG